MAALDGRVALVTGSTRRIGKAIAIELARAGADVVVNGRNPEPAEEVMAEIRSLGRRTFFEKANLIRWEPVKAMVDRVVEEYGRLDILALSGAAASSPPFSPFEEVDPAWYTRYAEAHWISKAYCIRAALDTTKRQGYGKVVSISTDAGRIPTVGESMIGGGAAGLLVMTKVLARELGRYGILVNAICITATESPGEVTQFDRSPSIEQSSAGARGPGSRQIFHVTSEDVAQAAVFLTSPESDTITGQILSVNGGTWGLG